MLGGEGKVGNVVCVTIWNEEKESVEGRIYKSV